MPVSSAIYRCSCSRSWVRHSTARLPASDTCPSCDGAGAQDDGPLAVLLKQPAPSVVDRAPESDASYRKRLMKVCSVRDRATVLICGPRDLDAIGVRYNLPRL